MREIEKMIKIYETYGFNPPLRGKYKRQENRIYFASNFQDNEEIEFFWNCEKPSACAKGNVFYVGKSRMPQLINISEIENLTPIIDKE